jgi:hypothetical protein
MKSKAPVKYADEPADGTAETEKQRQQPFPFRGKNMEIDRRQDCKWITEKSGACGMCRFFLRGGVGYGRFH